MLFLYRLGLGLGLWSVLTSGEWFGGNIMVKVPKGRKLHYAREKIVKEGMRNKRPFVELCGI